MGCRHHRPMKAAVQIVGAWTVLFVVYLVFIGPVLIARQAPACPEASRATSATYDPAIVRMCDERDRATWDVIRANEPGSWLAVWGIGVGVAATGGAVAWSRRSRTQEPASSPSPG
jgi:hypothetical protein